MSSRYKRAKQLFLHLLSLILQILVHLIVSFFFPANYGKSSYIFLLLLVFQTLSDLDPSLSYITDMASKVNSVIELNLFFVCVTL